MFLFVDSTEISKRATIKAMRKAQKVLLASVSHEFRNPLNSIKANADLLMKDGKMQEKQRYQVTIINKSTDMLLSLVEDILDIAKLDNGAFEL